MSPEKRNFLILNAVGGAAVLASYLWGVNARPDAGALLWGDLPGSWRPIYTVNMFLAATGYFLFTPWFLAADTDRARYLGGRSFSVINLCYAAVLIPSALWLPLTFWYVDAPSVLRWWVIRIDLLIVGAGALGLLAATRTGRGTPQRAWAATVGLLPFCLQTAVLDALVWPLYYRG